MTLVVCGWHTPDYRPWTEKLVASLDAMGLPHDIVEVPAIAGSWEQKTLAKPTQILAAMDRHPGKVILFLDVDCVVVRGVTHLASIIGDVGFYIATKFRRAGGTRFRVRSGTVVVRPTAAARHYIEAWAKACSMSPWGVPDQTAQMVAMGWSPGVSITVLGVEDCATEGDRVAAPNILHDSASRGVRKSQKWQRVLRYLIGR